MVILTHDESQEMQVTRKDYTCMVILHYTLMMNPFTSVVMMEFLSIRLFIIPENLSHENISCKLSHVEALCISDHGRGNKYWSMGHETRYPVQVLCAMLFTIMYFLRCCQVSRIYCISFPVQWHCPKKFLGKSPDNPVYNRKNKLSTWHFYEQFC